MAFQPLFITDFKDGVVKKRDQFLLPNDAFSELENAYIWRGRIKKKGGFYSLGLLQRSLVDQALGSATAGEFSVDIIDHLTLEDTSRLIPGTITIIVDSGGANEETFLEASTPDGTLVGSTGGTGIINYQTSNITITSNATWTTEAVIATFRYAPSLPLMGLTNRELVEINAEDLLAFDTKYAYRFSNSSDRFEELTPGTTWQGDNDHFFSSINYWKNLNGDIVFVTNFNKGASPDPMRYHDTLAWTDFAPAVDDSGSFLHQARFLLPFKGMLLAFDVYEGTTLEDSVNFPNRLRYSWVGDPLDTDAFKSNIIGKGGFIDATTSERLMSVNRIKDTIIVGFERSMYRIRYTGNEILPLVWEKINSVKGIESPFSTVEFDSAILGVGQDSIISCNGHEVNNIDQKIPDFAESIENDFNGHLRVHSTFDKLRELVYITYPTSNGENTYPTRILCYNPGNATYSILKDRFTTFGSWQSFDDTTWADLDYLTWAEWDTPWNQTGVDSLLPHVVAGNHHGEVAVYNNDNVRINDPIMMITDITSDSVTCPDHGLDDSDFIIIDGIIGYGSTLNDTIFKVFVVDSNTLRLFSLASPGFTGSLFEVINLGAGTYIGGGKLSHVNNIKIKSKRFNFMDSGVSTKLGYIDFLCNRTSLGKFNVDMYSGNNTSQAINTEDTERGRTVATFPYEDENNGIDKVLRRLFVNAVSQNVQFDIEIDDVNMMNKDIVASDIDIAAITVWVNGAGRIVT